MGLRRTAVMLLVLDVAFVLRTLLSVGTWTFASTSFAMTVRLHAPQRPCVKAREALHSHTTQLCRAVFSLGVMRWSSESNTCPVCCRRFTKVSKRTVRRVCVYQAALLVCVVSSHIIHLPATLCSCRVVAPRPPFSPQLRWSMRHRTKQAHWRYFSASFSATRCETCCSEAPHPCLVIFNKAWARRSLLARSHTILTPCAWFVAASSCLSADDAAANYGGHGSWCTSPPTWCGCCRHLGSWQPWLRRPRR